MAVRNPHKLAQVSSSSVQGIIIVDKLIKKNFLEGSSDQGVAYKECQELVI